MVTSNLDSTRSNTNLHNLSVKITIDGTKVGILHSKDIVECWFIEDIFSFNMYGKLVFYDNYGLVERGPLTGTEYISLVYGVEEVREVVFQVWKLNNIVQVSDVHPTDVSLIEIYFVDTSFYPMTVPKYSRSFEAGSKVTDIAKHLLKLSGWVDSNIKIEESKTILSEPFAFPYWSLAESIKYILYGAVGKISGTSGYLCYNNTNESFSSNIYTLNYLSSDQNVLDDKDYSFEGAAQGDFNKIWEWWIQGVDHSTLGLVRGGKFRAFDPTQKKLLLHEHTFSDGIGNTILNGKRAIFSDISEVNSSQIIYNFPSLEKLKNVVYDNWAKKYNLQNMLNIIIQGNEKRYAGMQIQINWKSIDNVEQIWQKQLEGKYIIKSITHNFSGIGTSNVNYMQKAVLIKNAYQDSNSKILANATKTNLTGGKRKRIINV